ncbi:MAG: hypothetical protein ACR2P5_05275, partial [Gammaproteobacteria bacterium]
MNFSKMFQRAFLAAVCAVFAVVPPVALPEEASAPQSAPASEGFSYSNYLRYGYAGEAHQADDLPRPAELTRNKSHAITAREMLDSF